MNHWTEKDVAERFEEAIATLRKLPAVRVRGYFNAWPEIVRSPREIATGDIKPMRLRPLPDAIDRMEETLDWIFWVNEQERKLIWSRASKKPWKVICQEIGYSRSIAWKKWQHALLRVAKRLNGKSFYCVSQIKVKERKQK